MFSTLTIAFIFVFVFIFIFIFIFIFVFVFVLIFIFFQFFILISLIGNFSAPVANFQKNQFPDFFASDNINADEGGDIGRSKDSRDGGKKGSVSGEGRKDSRDGGKKSGEGKLEINE